MPISGHHAVTVSAPRMLHVLCHHQRSHVPWMAWARYTTHGTLTCMSLIWPTILGDHCSANNRNLEAMSTDGTGVCGLHTPSQRSVERRRVASLYASARAGRPLRTGASVPLAAFTQRVGPVASLGRYQN